MRHFMRSTGTAGEPLANAVRMRIIHQRTVVTHRRRAEFRWTPKHRSAASAPALIDLCTTADGAKPIGGWALLCSLCGRRLWHANCLYMAAHMIALVATIVGTFMCAGAADRRHALYAAAVRRFVEEHQQWVIGTDGRRSLLVGDEDWTNNGSSVPALNADEQRESERWRSEYAIWAAVFVACWVAAAWLRSGLASVALRTAARLRGTCVAALVQRGLEQGGGGPAAASAAIRADHVRTYDHRTQFHRIVIET